MPPSIYDKLLNGPNENYSFIEILETLAIMAKVELALREPIVLLDHKPTKNQPVQIASPRINQEKLAQILEEISNLPVA